MAALLTNQTSNATGTAAAHSGPCTVIVRGAVDGAKVVLKMAFANTPAHFHTFGPESIITSPKGIVVDAVGDYYLLAELEDAGENTNVTVETNQ